MKQCEQKQKTIKVADGNAFALLLPLKRRTYVSNIPIDEDINCAELEDVSLTIGGVEYDTELGTDGVRVYVPELARGTYDIILTAVYHEASIRAAYFEGLSIVDWNYQSDAERFLPGSPIVADAAIIIGGPLTDQELADLKLQYQNAIAEEQAAKLAYEESKAALDEKAEALDDIAQETTSQQILEKLDNIDFSEIVNNINDIKTLVGEATDPATADTIFGRLQEVLNAISNIDFSALAKQGSNPNATNSAILEAIGQIAIDDPYSQALAAFFGITPPVPNAVPMTQQEVEDDLDELWNLIITQ